MDRKVILAVVCLFCFAGVFELTAPNGFERLRWSRCSPMLVSWPGVTEIRALCFRRIGFPTLIPIRRESTLPPSSRKPVESTAFRG